MIIHKKIVVPDDVDLFFIGDIHGDYKNFNEVIRIAGVVEGDYIIAVGDLIDRGNGVAPLLFDFLHKPNYHAVIGNHEEMMINVHEPYNRDLWLYMGNGGDKTLEQLGWEGVKYFTDLIVKKFPIILEVHHRGKTFGVIHACAPLLYENTENWNDIIKLAKKDPDYREQLYQDVDLHRKLRNAHNEGGQEKENVLNTFKAIKGIDYIFHGHVGVTEPFIHHNMVWIDTMFLDDTFTLAYFDEKTNKLTFLNTK